MRLIIVHILGSISPRFLNSFYKYENIIVFLFRIGVLILSWKVIFHFVWHSEYLLESYNKFSLLVIDFIPYCCAYLLELLQYNIEVDSANRIVKIKETIGVTVGVSCIGYEITALYTALIISFKGPISKKMWFIPLGVLMIYILNIFRICALAIMVTINQKIWELNHKLIFTVIIYSFIFIVWRYWLKINKSLN